MSSTLKEVASNSLVIEPRSEAMKRTASSRLLEILREREFELFAIRRSFDELRDKFLQLENAFGINLRVQLLLENELELLKLSKAPSKLKNNLLSEMEDENLKARTKLRSSLRKILAEKKRWKEAFLRQRKITESQKLEHSQSIETMRDECENILKTCRESGEKYFRELLDLYEDSREKVKVFDVALKAVQARESSTRNRILELANLLETLEKFQGVRIEMLCRRSAKALRSLVTVGVDSYEDEMRKLRQVTWDVKENYQNHESLEFLQAQNSVLRQVVKSLKRKAEFHRANEKLPHFVKTNRYAEGNFEDTGMKEVKKNEKNEKSRNDSEVSFRESDEENAEEEPVKDVDNLMKNKKKCSSRRFGNSGVETCFSDEITTDEMQTSRRGKQSGINDRIFKRIYVDAIESHRDGIPYEEYNFNLFNDRQLKVRHCNSLGEKDATLLVEFVETENDFQKAPLDRTVFYLGDRVESIVRVKKSVMHCGVQTREVKNCEKFVQTTATGINGFSRINAGVGMLNSEKRAIERSIINLEHTLSSLKENALDEARSMIGKEAKRLGNKFFDCVERLKR